jgi:peptidoglycan/LPS O-acetylase OafA/YrhL
MFVHMDDHYAGLFRPDSGYLAVDLFFLLSGFVIANAYDRRFNPGWGVAEFLKVRLIRLYPLYFLAFMVGALKLLVQLGVGMSPPPLRDVATDIGLAILMLPSPTTIGHKFDPTFPMNLPAWSLFFELIVNIAYASAHRWLTHRVLICLVATSGATLLGVILIHGSDAVGNLWHTFGYGLPRAAFPFFLGILMSRARFGLPRLGNFSAAALAVVLICVLVIPPGSGRMLWDIGSIFLAFPVLVALGAAVEVKGVVGKACLWAGLISYALYVLHLPTIGIADAVLKRLSPSLHLAVQSGPVFVVLLILGCWAIDRYYDLPMRRWLTWRSRPPHDL